MKILAKNEVSAAKNVDRKREIDEGVKLVRKVEALRKTHANEEATLKVFREQSVAQAMKDIEELVERKQNLTNEVADLEAKKIAANVPLDSEWERLREWEKEVAGRHFDNQTTTDLLAKATDLLSERERGVNFEEERLADERARSKKMLGEALIKDTQADNKLKMALEAEIASQERHAERSARIDKREKDLVARETASVARHSELDERERLAKENERAIQDRYDTLLRTEQRHGNGKRK